LLFAQSEASLSSGLRPTDAFRAFTESALDFCLVEHFHKQVEATPDAPAVVEGEQHLSYAALNREAVRLAVELRRRAPDPEKPVCILMQNSPQLIAALLGVLKAGHFYLTVDPSYPRQRIEFILEDSGAALCVTNRSHRQFASSLVGESRGMLDVDELSRSEESTVDCPAVSGERPACLFYTSGSTGRPKGVLMGHRSVLFDIGRQTNDLYLSSDDRFDLLFSTGFSASLAPIFGALLNGASLHLMDTKSWLHHLGRWIDSSQITVSTMTVTMFRHVAQTLTAGNHFPAMRLLSVGGEAVYRSDVDLFRDTFSRGCVLQNALATTETRTYAQFFINRDTEITEKEVPAGFPVGGKELLLLGDVGKTSDAEREGQIGVRSKYLASEYWNQPQLTQEKFRRDSHCVPEEVLYLTGDLGRWRADGALMFLGRQDSQVKIRGHRVEIGEVEHALSRCGDVREAAVTVRRKDGGDAVLIAHVVSDGVEVPKVSSLRTDLSATLPDFMIPTVFWFIDEMPLTPTGKVDRRALSEP